MEHNGRTVSQPIRRKLCARENRHFTHFPCFLFVTQTNGPHSNWPQHDINHFLFESFKNLPLSTDAKNRFEFHRSNEHQHWNGFGMFCYENRKAIFIGKCSMCDYMANKSRQCLRQTNNVQRSYIKIPIFTWDMDVEPNRAELCLSITIFFS